MNKGLKSAGWLLIAIALIQSAADRNSGVSASASAPQLATLELAAR